jgi:hypothetical protein
MKASYLFSGASKATDKSVYACYLFSMKASYLFSGASKPQINQCMLVIYSPVYQYRKSLYENASLIIFSAETEYISTRY